MFTSAEISVSVEVRKATACRVLPVVIAMGEFVARVVVFVVAGI